MPISSEFISTQEVAGLFRVTETTVKRWANDGIIPCAKSPGGHRKFLLRDVIRFAEELGHPISGTLEPPLTESQMTKVRTAIHARNYHAIAEVLFDEALQADPEGLFRILLYLSKHNVKLSTLADEILRPPLVRMGQLWEAGKLRVDQEHRSSRALTDAMVRLSPELHRKEPNGMRAVCACPEGERHEIGLRAMAYALEAEGWDVSYLGADTPYGAIADAVRTARPELLCLSFTSPAADDRLRKGFALAGRAVRSAGGKFMAGGFYASGFTPGELHCDHVAASVTEGISWLREAFSLRPGPKKKKHASRAPKGAGKSS